MNSRRLPPSLSDHLQRSSTLTFYFDKAGALAGYDDDLKQQLPEALRAHVNITLENQQLTLFAANNAVAQLLRFHAKSLQQRVGASRVKVVISPPPTLLPAERTCHRHLPIEAAELLKALAKTVNPPLSDALMRLSSHADNKNDNAR